MTSYPLRLTIIMTALISTWGASLASAVELVKEGAARAVIVLTPEALVVPEAPEAAPRKKRAPAPADPHADVKLAAAELVEHIERMSGAKIEIIARGADLAGRVPIYLDQAANPSLDAATRKTSTDPAAFTIQAGDKSVSIRGLSQEGTLFGCYEMLEQLGVRWFMPGEFGRVIPASKTVALANRDTTQGPSFPARWAAGYASKSRVWQRRMRMGGLHFPPAHGIKMPATHNFAAKPECYALINGERRNRQLCLSNPETLAGAVETVRNYFRANTNAPWIGIGPHDGRGFCECDGCKALDGGDWDPFAAYMSMTDRYLGFFNGILDAIAAEFPDKKIAFYSYASYNRPPVKVKPNPRIVPAFAPITICRIHGLGNPICPEKDKYYRWMVGEWGKILPEIYDRGYWFNLACPGFLFPMVHRIRTQIPISHELGITGWRVECLAHWGSEAPSLYIAGKLMWNHQADVDALMSDYASAFFGPAAKPMGAYISLIDTRIRDTDVHTGSSYDIPLLYPPEVRQAAAKLLDEAAAQAPDEPYATRVKAMRQVFDYTDAFCVMMDSRAANQWPAAAAALKRVDNLLDVLTTTYDIELVTREYGITYMKRFFRAPITQGYERAVTAGTFLAGLPDIWSFQLDPGAIGEPLQWYSSDLTGGNWRDVRTSSSSWSNQGLRYYKGEAWYRQSVDLPAIPKDRKVLLWFGGVDEKARVWLNDHLLGDSPGRAFVPFEFDVTAFVRPQGRNVVGVRIINATLNEVGTGGIVAPVFFWMPNEAGHTPTWGSEDVTPIEFK